MSSCLTIIGLRQTSRILVHRFTGAITAAAKTFSISHRPSVRRHPPSLHDYLDSSAGLSYQSDQENLSLLASSLSLRRSIGGFASLVVKPVFPADLSGVLSRVAVKRRDHLSIISNLIRVLLQHTEHVLKLYIFCSLFHREPWRSHSQISSIYVVASFC